MRENIVHMLLIDVFFSVSLLVAIIVVLYPLRKGQARKYILDYLYLFQLAWAIGYFSSF